MVRAARRIGWLVMVAAVAACDVDRITIGVGTAGLHHADRWDPWLITDRTTYVARYTASTVILDINFQFENRSRVAVAIPRCTQPHRPVLDKLVAGEWVEVFTPLETCWDQPLVVGPGRTSQFSVRVRAGLPHTNIHPQFRTSHVPGTYRLRWDLYRYEPHAQFRIGAALPLEYRVSNEFRIVH